MVVIVVFGPDDTNYDRPYPFPLKREFVQQVKAARKENPSQA